MEPFRAEQARILLQSLVCVRSGHYFTYNYGAVVSLASNEQIFYPLREYGVSLADLELLNTIQIAKFEKQE